MLSMPPPSSTDFLRAQEARGARLGKRTRAGQAATGARPGEGAGKERGRGSGSCWATWTR